MMYPQRLIHGQSRQLMLIAKALWGNRPHWRSTELLFATCTDASRTHPQVAIACRILLNICSRCRRDRKFAELWTELCNKGKVVSKGLLNVFIHASSTLGLEFQPPCKLRFLGIQFSFTDFLPKQMKRICRIASSQCLFSTALQSHRQDLLKGGSGILDSEMAPPGSTHVPWRSVMGYEEALVPGFLTGASPTGNRLVHAGTATSSTCRFCGQEKETIRHLTESCSGIHSILGKPLMALPEQPNLASHGIFEVPTCLLQTNLEDWSGEEVPQWDGTNPGKIIWGDGSIVNPDHFYSKTMGFAIADEEGNVLFKHALRDPTACSFKAELLAFSNQKMWTRNSLCD